MLADQRHPSFQRVLIVGPPGAGKTSFGKKLAECLNQPLYHLDDYYWLPGWQRIDKEAWLQKLRELCSHRTWIIDGGHANTFSQRAAYADTVIILDYSPLLCLWRFCKRSIKRYVKINDNLPVNIQNDPFRETKISIQWHLLRLILQYRRKTKPDVFSISRALDCDVIIFKNDRRSESFLNRFK